MDCSTRFILSCDISHKKFGYNAYGLFRMAAEQAGCLPRILVTDGLNSFATASKVFYRRAGTRFVHVSEAHMRDEFNNNNIQGMQSGPP